MSESLNFDENVNATDFSEEKGGFFPASVYQKVGANVPVTIEPFAHAGKIKTKYCGEPVIVPEEKPCPDKRKKACTFIVSQTICVEVPIAFGAKTFVGESFTECLGASTENICRKCHRDCKGEC